MDTGQIILLAFIAASVGLIIFAAVSEIQSGHADYVIFCLLLIIGIFALSFAVPEMADFVQGLLRQVNIYASDETAEKISTFFILAWLIAIYLFYKSQKKK